MAFSPENKPFKNSVFLLQSVCVYMCVCACVGGGGAGGRKMRSPFPFFGELFLQEGRDGVEVKWRFI